MTSASDFPDDVVRLRQAKGMPFMFKSTSTSLILLGILAVIVGIIAIAWPGVTILALVILFAIYAFMAAGLQGARAFSSRNAGPVFGHLLLGLIDLGAGRRLRRDLRRVPERGDGRHARDVHRRRAGVRRLRRRALRPPQRRRGHPRAPVRPVQHDLRVLADHSGRPGPSAGPVCPVAFAAAQGSLTVTVRRHGARTGFPPAWYG